MREGGLWKSSNGKSIQRAPGGADKTILNASKMRKLKTMTDPLNQQGNSATKKNAQKVHNC